MSAHAMLAGLTNTKELALDPNEGKALGEATVNVMKLYPGSVVSDKMVAWSNLCFIAGAVYAPRFVVIRDRMKREARERAAANPVQTAPQSPSQMGDDPFRPTFGTNTFDPADLASRTEGYQQ